MLIEILLMAAQPTELSVMHEIDDALQASRIARPTSSWPIEEFENRYWLDVGYEESDGQMSVYRVEVRKVGTFPVEEVSKWKGDTIYVDPLCEPQDPGDDRTYDERGCVEIASGVWVREDSNLVATNGELTHGYCESETRPADAVDAMEKARFCGDKSEFYCDDHPEDRERCDQDYTPESR